MVRDKFALNVKAGAGAGTAFPCRSHIHQTVILRPGLAGTTPLSVLQLQVSNTTDADAEFVNYGAAADNGLPLPISLSGQAWAYLRVFTSGYVSGTPSASWAGDDSRTV